MGVFFARDIFTFFFVALFIWFISLILVFSFGIVLYLFLLIFKIKRNIHIYGLIVAGIIILAIMFFGEFFRGEHVISVLPNAFIFFMYWRKQEKRLQKEEL